jgi:hypothetical protein
MKSLKLALAFILVFIVTFSAGAGKAQASGMPGGGQFGFGAWLDSTLAAQQSSSVTASSLAVALAAQNHINWIAINLDWSAVAPMAGQAADLSSLATLIQEADQQKLEILLSIQNPPAWALTANGPAPEHVQGLISQVSLVANNRVLAIELFPGANLARTWGAPANPAAYLSVIQAARSALRTNQQVTLVIPSLTPLFQVSAAGDLSAEDFLKAVYQMAPNEVFQVIGLHFSQITGRPEDYAQSENGVFLRQYEMIRQVMLDHQHSSDQIWITAFAWPESLTNEMEQAAWVESAYRQLQGQIYIKAAFFDALYVGANPGANANKPAALLEPTLKAHAALARIRALAAPGASAIESFTSGLSTPNSGETEEKGSLFAWLWDFICSLFGWN